MNHDAMPDAKARRNKKATTKEYLYNKRFASVGVCVPFRAMAEACRGGTMQHSSDEEVSASFGNLYKYLTELPPKQHCKESRNSETHNNCKSL